MPKELDYTFRHLLADLQAMTPEQLAQPARVWGEQVPYVAIAGVEVAKSDYVCEDGEVWPVGDVDLEGEEYDPYIKQGETWLWLNY